MKFTPKPGLVEITPIEKDSKILSEDSQFLEKGIVVEGGDEFYKGWIVYFEAWGCTKTVKDSEGKEHYVVDPQTILGYEHDAK